MNDQVRVNRNEEEKKRKKEKKGTHLTGPRQLKLCEKRKNLLSERREEEE